MTYASIAQRLERSIGNAEAPCSIHGRGFRKQYYYKSQLWFMKMENRHQIEIEFEQVWDHCTRDPQYEGLLVKFGEVNYDVCINGKFVEDRKELEVPEIESIIGIARAIVNHYEAAPPRRLREREQLYPGYVKITKKDNEMMTEARF